MNKVARELKRAINKRRNEKKRISNIKGKGKE